MSCVLALAVGALAGCGPSGSGGGAAVDSISGAGATFPAPIYMKWGEDYNLASKVAVNYQAIGSGAGISQIKSKTVDFGASDKPLKPEDLEAAGLYQFPAVMGGVVPIYNLPGIAAGQLKLTGPVLGDIYLGKVTTWNAKEIADLNPGVTLPATKITVNYRADGSGTTFVFTSYLTLKNPEWNTKVGASDSVSWPTGVGSKGNDGVAASVANAAGAIGYVEYSYAKQNNIAFASMQTKDGGFTAPTAESFAAAAASADWTKAPGNYLLLLDQPGAQSWPITAATFILMHKKQDDAARAAAVLKFFDWAYANGDAAAGTLDYVPMPAAVKDMVRGQWKDIVGADGKPVYTPGT